MFPIVLSYETNPKAEPNGMPVWHARFERAPAARALGGEHVEYEGIGRTPEQAIGFLIMSHPVDFPMTTRYFSPIERS